MLFKQTDSAVLPFSQDEMFSLLADFAGYHKWWPRRFRVKYLSEKSILLIRPYPLVKIGMLIEEVNRPEKIKIEYTQTTHTGWGEWQLKKVEGGTKLSYQMQVEPRFKIFYLPYRVAFALNIHGGHMKQIFTALKKHLKQNSR